MQVPISGYVKRVQDGHGIGPPVETIGWNSLGQHAGCEGDHREEGETLLTWEWGGPCVMVRLSISPSFCDIRLLKHMYSLSKCPEGFEMVIFKLLKQGTGPLIPSYLISAR